MDRTAGVKYLGSLPATRTMGRFLAGGRRRKAASSDRKPTHVLPQGYGYGVR
jgi:hypothetical protein